MSRMNTLLLNEEIYHRLIQEEIPAAHRFVWIATADIKDLHVERGKRYIPFLRVLDELVGQGVAVRLIHAKEPGPRFRADFDQCAALLESDLFERILCPRVHLKCVIIDGRLAFHGSPNLTGAGMGSKHPDRRNFESGILTDDPAQVATLMDFLDRLYLGEFCTACKLRDLCPDPIG